VGGRGFFLFYFVFFLYIFHILLSSRCTQLLGAAAGWGSAGPTLAGGVREDDPHGCCHPAWPLHLMGGGPFPRWQHVTDTHLPFQAGPAPELARWERGEAGVGQRQRAGASVASWLLFQPRPHPTEGCHCACPHGSTGALSPCAPCLDAT